MPTPLNVRLAQYHQDSSYETYTLTPPGGKYGCQPVPERLIYSFPTRGPSHLPVTNSSLLWTRPNPSPLREHVQPPMPLSGWLCGTPCYLGSQLKSHCPLQPHFQGPEPAEPSLSFQLVRRWGLSGALDKRLAHQESRESCSHKGLFIDQSHKKGLLRVFQASTMPVALRSVRETRR